MARIILDQTGNTHQDRTLGNINANFADLYGNSLGSATDPSVNSLTTAAGVTVGTVMASATLTTSGLATEQSLKLDIGTKTVTASGGAATLNKSAGIVTSEALTTAAGSDYTLTLTNSVIAAGDQALVSIDSNGSTGLPLAYSVKTTSTTLTVIIRNIHATAAFNAALKITFAIFKN